MVGDDTYVGIEVAELCIRLLNQYNYGLAHITIVIHSVTDSPKTMLVLDQ